MYGVRAIDWGQPNIIAEFEEREYALEYSKLLDNLAFRTIVVDDSQYEESEIWREDA